MKNIFKFSFLALFIAVASCEDATDIVQESELNEETAYQTVDDLQSGLNGVYAAYGPDFGDNNGGDYIQFNDLFTDNIKRGFQSSGQGATEYAFIINSVTSFPQTIWGNRYGTINFANRVLRNIDRVTENASDADIARANHIRSQLLALRALSHFDLLQYFTPDYKNPSSPSVIIMDFVPELGAVFPRNTVSEVFDFVLSDLEAAENLMDPGAFDTFYLTPDALKAIKARVLLFRDNPADYATIEQLTEELLVSHPIITNADNYDNFWADANLTDNNIKEDIFTLFRGASDNAIADLWYANETNINGSPVFEMSNELYDLYTSNDIRKSVFVDATSDLDGENRTILIDKYPGSSVGLLVNHVKLLRSSEMLLIKAEVEARQGKFAEAAASVQSLRVARHIGNPQPELPVYSNLTEALRDILLERRKELCFEGHRYLDLKRIGKEINVGISRDPRDCASFSAPCDLPPTDYRFTMPIPRDETNANPSIVQNPGY